MEGRSRRQRQQKLGGWPDSPRRVYFVGAGFSAGMGYPVGNRLPTCLMSYLRGESPVGLLSERHYENSLFAASPRGRLEAERIVKTIEFFVRQFFNLPATSLDQIDVAEFYTLAQSLADMPSLFGRDEAAERDGRLPISQLYPALAAVTRSYFTDISATVRKEVLPADLASLFDSLRSERDALVNFNWDEEVDFFGEQGYVTYSLASWRSYPRRRRKGRLLVLRPHGSVGWYDVMQGLGNDQMFFIAEDDERVPRSKIRIVAFPGVELPLDLVSGRFQAFDFPPVIMPPTFAKRFVYEEQLQIWEDVLAVCTAATEFVFLGYSLVPDDFLTRAAIRSALRAGSREEIRCLVVSRSFNQERVNAFRSVFDDGFKAGSLHTPGLSAAKNHLPWDFGKRQPNLAGMIEKQLKDATITADGGGAA
jgi:hypothetical protein